MGIFSKKKLERLSRIQSENVEVFNAMAVGTDGDPSARALGTILCAIYERQGQMLSELQEIAGNSYR